MSVEWMQVHRHVVYLNTDAVSLQRFEDSSAGRNLDDVEMIRRARVPTLVRNGESLDSAQ